MPRLPIYPSYALDLSMPWLHDAGGSASIGAATRRAMDSSGLVRGSDWWPGLQEAGEASAAPHQQQLPENARDAVAFATGTAELEFKAAAGGSDGRSAVVGGQGDLAASGATSGGHPHRPEASTAHSGTTEGSSASPNSPDHTSSRSSASSSDQHHGTGPPSSSSAPSSSSPSRPKKSSIPLPRVKQRMAWQVALQEDGCLAGLPRPPASPKVQSILRKVLDHGGGVDFEEVVALFQARGADFEAVCSAADALRERVNGDTVSYVVNRNINYTNVCTYKCQFCAFSKGRMAEDLRGPAYLTDLPEITRRVAEAWERGATEVGGGLSPADKIMLMTFIALGSTSYSNNSHHTAGV